MPATTRSASPAPVRPPDEGDEVKETKPEDGGASSSSPKAAVEGSANGASDAAAPASKPKLRIIYLTVFLDFFANGVVLPVLQNHARGLGASGFNVGMVFTSYSAAQIPGSFLFGRLSDFQGRRPVILISLLMSTVTLMMTLAAPDLRSLIITRAIAGFFSETSICQAYIADKTTKEQRSAALGHMGAFIGLAFVLGPATGALLGVFGGFGLAIKFTTVVTALNLVYAYRSLDESLQPENESSGEGVGLKDLMAILSRPVIIGVLVGQCALTIAFMGWDTTYAMWAADRLGYQQKHVGWAFSWLAVGFFMASWKTRTFAKDPGNTSRGCVLGCSMMAAGLLAHRIVRSTLMSLLPLFGIGFGYALSEIVFQTLVSVHSSRGLQGSTLGALGASQAVARAFAPVLTGYLFDVAPGGDLDFAYCVLAMGPGVAMLASFAPRSVVESEDKKQS